ncbi:hypothetical protein [Pedobacter alpinus]|uniref:DUF4412 domain-containing protein n=1 Tax=Pedobacter alpinus TaxID=1590643 RepID=A0ABW5TWH6_9SPHI
MKKLVLLILTMVSVGALKAQTPAEIEKAQKEAMQQISKQLNCDTLSKLLNAQYNDLDKTQLTKEQLTQYEANIDSQIKICKEYAQFLKTGSYPNTSEPENEEVSKPETNLEIGEKKPNIKSLEISAGYKITYLIKDEGKTDRIDMYLSDTSPNYTISAKDPETGQKFYSIYKANEKKIYSVAQNMVITMDMNANQKSMFGDFAPDFSKIQKYKLTPTGKSKTIAGYLSQEFSGKDEEGNPTKIWISYSLKTGSYIMPGTKYVEAERAIYKKVYSNDNQGFFLAFNTVASGGTTEMIAESIQKITAPISISVEGYNWVDRNQMMNNLTPPKN